MDLSFLRDCGGRIIAGKRALILFSVLFLLGIILGFCFIKTPAVYDYHLAACLRFTDEICFSDRNVMLIFFERLAGHTLLLLLIILSGVHFAVLVLPPVLLLFRAYTLGGSLVIFFSVFGVTGVLVALVLYLPIHLCVDAVLLGGTVLSCARAPGFRFRKGDFSALLLDFSALLLLLVLISLAETVLLLAVFHPIGTIL